MSSATRNAGELILYVTIETNCLLTGIVPPAKTTYSRNAASRMRAKCRGAPCNTQRPIHWVFFVVFLFSGDYISRVRAEHASAPLRSRTRTTHWWQPPALCVPLQEGQVGVQESPHNTEGLPLLCYFFFLPGGLLHKQGPRRARPRAAPLPHSHNALLATSCCCAPVGGPRRETPHTRTLNRLPFLGPIFAVGWPLHDPGGPRNQLKKSKKAGSSA
jgi:hypothetical protein